MFTESSFGRHEYVSHIDINGLLQERRNSIANANALELRLSYTNPSM